MPTYDYECKKCHHRFEEIQSFSSEPVATCPRCRAKAVRQFSVPIVVYKGSGFYTTDHGRGSNGAAQKSGDADSAGKSGSSSSGKSGGGASSSKSEGASVSKSSDASDSSSSSRSDKSEKKEAVKASLSSQSKN